MNYKFLSLEQIIQLHVLAIAQFGGSEGVRDLGRLESAVASQTQELFGEDIYKNIFDKAAALMRNIIGDHPFSDGNKRTAMLSGITLLELNGYRFTIDRGGLEDFAVQIATEHLEVLAIAAWLRAHSKKCR